MQQPRFEYDRACLASARNNVEAELVHISSGISCQEATDGRASDMIYVICVAAFVLAAYW